MLLDSNIIIYAIQPEHEIVREFLAQDNSQVSAISLVEVLGYSKLTPADEANLRTVFSAFSVLQVTINIIEGAIALRRRQSMSLGDAIIASTALANGLTLATRNVNDFRWIDGLNLFDPFNPSP